MSRAAALALALALAVGCAGQPVAPDPPAPRRAPTVKKTFVGDLGVKLDRFDEVTELVKSIGAQWGDAARFRGFVLVAQHDQPIYAQAFGFADRRARRRATVDTSFRVGSISKQFTATAILRLVQAGKLSVDDPVSKHLPEFPGPGKDVTIHQLLTHTSGIPSYTDDATVMARKGQRWTVPAVLATFWDKPLQFTPGTEHIYSNSNYAVLGAIIERVSGRDYARFVRDELFWPAGMTRTLVGDAEGDPDRAIGYRVGPAGVLEPAEHIDMSLPFAAGSIRSTASDLMRWHRALAGNDILDAPMRDKLFTPALAGYAYGWRIDEIFGRRAQWHGGGIEGFRGDYWRVPDSDLVVIVLGNSSGIDTHPIAKACLAAAFGHDVQPLPQPRRMALDEALVPRVAGTYQITVESKRSLRDSNAPAQLIGSVLTVTITGLADGIQLKPNGQPPVKLAPTGAAEFFDPGTNIRAIFDLSFGRRAAGLTVEQGPLRIVYQRGR